MHGYGRAVRRVLLVVLALNALVAAAKIATGWWAGSLSVLGDGLHSAIDATHNVVALVLVYYATRPPDDDHPFGHGKIETIGAFALGGVLFLTAFELASAAIGRLLSGRSPESVEPITAAVLVVTLSVNVVVSWAEARAGKRLKSEMLVADSRHTRSDVYVTLAVLGGLGAQMIGIAWADAAIALAVSGIIAWAGYDVFKSAVPILTDAVVYDPAEVESIVRDIPGVESVHDVRSRGRPHEAFIQMHLVVETDDVVEAHRITEAVERRLEEELGAREVLVHVEPEDDSDTDAHQTPPAGAASG